MSFSGSDKKQDFHRPADMPAGSTAQAIWFEQRRNPSVIDLGFRAAYKLAQRMLTGYSYIFRKGSCGALVALWYEGHILMVKNSYRRYYSLPGGYIAADEAPEHAGARELREEIGISIPIESLRPAYEGTGLFEGREDSVIIFEASLNAPPRMHIDNREVVWAAFVTADYALGLPTSPHLAEYLRTCNSQRLKK